MKKIALFDFDGTITNKDTTKYLIIELLRLRPYLITFIAYSLLRLKFSNQNTDKQSSKNKVIGILLNNLSDTDISNALLKFSNKAKSLFRKKVLDRINELIENDVKVLIVTASPKIAVEACFDDLLISVIGTKFQKVDEIYNGNLKGLESYGSNKVELIKRFLGESKADHIFVEAWSDDFLDYDMLMLSNNRYWIGTRDFYSQIINKDSESNFILVDE